MATLSLKISVVGKNLVKTMQFEPSMVVYDVCRIIRDRLKEAGIPAPPGNPNDFGLFLADEDIKKGLWLEAGRALDYYLLRSGDLLEYKTKIRILKVRTLDGTERKMQVDDSHTVGQMLIAITSKIGITNHEEYSLIIELPDDEKEKTLTLKRDKSIAKDQKKLEEMKRRLHTEDDMNWLDHAKTLREQGINTDEETLLLRRKFFFSDQNVDARDPVQLNLLFVQTRDAILNGTHPVSQEESIMFAGIQCQIQFGDHDDHKHKPGLFENKEFLPKEYCKVKGIEKKIFQEHRKWSGYSERDAKVKYTQQCRALKTYGITFFLVKEKVKGKNKLVPRLLGINKESVVRVDEKTKEIMKHWPLTTVRRWAASPNSFTLDFGDHADQYYSVQTQEGEQIAALIAGYIDIILRKKKAKDHLGIEGDDDALMFEENVSSAKATIISHQSHNVNHAQTGSVSIPGVMRDGGGGENQFSTGSMQQAMFSMQSNQAHAGQAIRQQASAYQVDNGYDFESSGFRGFDQWNRIDQNGSDQNAFNSMGFSGSGLNQAGFSQTGLNQMDFGQSGLNQYGFDQNAFTQSTSFDQNAFGHMDFNQSAFKPMDFDQAGLNQMRFNPMVFDQNGFQPMRFDQSGFNQFASDWNTSSQMGFTHSDINVMDSGQVNFNQMGFGPTRFRPIVFDEARFNQVDSNQTCLNQMGLDEVDFNQSGFSQSVVEQRSFSQSGFDCSQNVFTPVDFPKPIYNPSGFSKTRLGRKETNYSKTFDQKVSQQSLNQDSSDNTMSFESSSNTKALEKGQSSFDQKHTGLKAIEHRSVEQNGPVLVGSDQSVTMQKMSTSNGSEQNQNSFDRKETGLKAIEYRSTEQNGPVPISSKHSVITKNMSTSKGVEQGQSSFDWKDSGHRAMEQRDFEQKGSDMGGFDQIRYIQTISNKKGLNQGKSGQSQSQSSFDQSHFDQKQNYLNEGHFGQQHSSFGQGRFGQEQSRIGYNSYSSMSQSFQEHGLTQAQRALVLTIDDGLSAVNQAQSELDKQIDMPQLGTDAASRKWRENNLDLSRQKVSAQLSAINAATAQLVTLTGNDEPDYGAVGASVNQVSSNLGDFTHDIRMLAALQEDGEGGNRLLDAARRLAGGLSDLLNAVQPERQEPRQNVLAAASRVGEASHDVMDGVGETGEDMDRAYQDTLIALAKAVANATAQLVLKAKTVASTTDDTELQNRVISSATQCALATSQLVACTKVVAPTIGSQACQEQLIEAAKMVAQSVEGVVDQAASVTQDEKVLQDLGGAATAVTQALNDLLKHIKLGAGPTTAGESQEEAVDTILSVTDRLFSSVGDAHEMVKQARQLAQATSMLVNTIRGQAESHPDSDVQKRLLAAAKALADATAKMVEAAKGCASSPNDSERQVMLRSAAEELRSATNTAASNALKKKLMQRLESAAKQCATASTQLINASNSANKTNTNQTSKHELEMQCHTVNEELPALVQGFRGVVNNRDSARAQLTLLKTSQKFVQPANSLVNAANAAAPTVTDQAACTNLHSNIKSMSAALAELRTASSKAQEAMGFMELESALEEVRELDKELIEMKQSANSGTLRPLPGETAESCASNLGANSKKVGSAMAQLLTAAAQGNDNYVGIAARDTANALRIFVNAARGVAANSNDRQEQGLILDSAREVIAKSNQLLEAARNAIDNPNNPDNQQRLQQVAKAVSNSLDTCVNCLPGQRDVDIAIRQITETSQSLSSQKFPSTNKSFMEVQNEMSDAAANFNTAAGDIITNSQTTTQQLSKSSEHYSKVYQHFVDTGLTLAGLAKDADTQNQIVGGLKSVSMVSSKLLLAAKSVSIDPNAPNAKNLLAQAARAVTESINQLINICTVSAPGQKECDNALRQIEMMKSWLENPNEPVSDMPYFECLDTVMEKSRHLGGAMTGMTNHAKKGEMDEFCSSVASFSSSVCGLTEASVQAAYLVGIADPASEPGRPGLVDQSQFSRANQAIQMACQNLTNPASSQQQVLSAATVVAKHTSALCNACRLASSKTDNPVAKRHFVQSAKDVANSTANLVKAIKALDSNFTEDNRQKCAEAAKPLVDAVDELTTFASSPEFASKQAKISPEARKAQEPITSAGKGLITGACQMLEAAKQLATKPKDPQTYQLYSTHSKSVSDSIKRLVSSIRDSAPGQKECDVAIEKTNKSIRDLDQASLAAISQNLSPRHERTLRSYQEQMISCCREVIEIIESVKHAASKEPESLGHVVTKMANYLDPLSEAAIGAASLMTNSKQQMSTLDLTKTVIESALQFLYSSKEGGGNPKAVTAQENITTAADDMRDVVQDLLHMLEDSVSQAGEVTTMIDKISKSITKTDDRVEVKPGLGYVDYQTNMVKLAKNIAKTAQDMVGKAATDVDNLGLLANQLTRDFDLLASDSRGAAASVQNTDVANRIRVNVQDLGKTCIELVQDAGNLQANPSDSYARQDLTMHARSVSEKVSYILATLQSGSRGTQACINAAHTVSGIIADLDTTIMFATAGTLNTDGDESFADHRENILKTAKALVEDTKTLVAGAASNQEQLAGAAQMAVKTITRLADVVKFGAGSLGSEQQEAQVLLINAVKDVASALSDLISATKNASGKSVQDPAMLHLKESAKVMVTNVTSLLKTVKSVEDEATRGTRALESTIEAIGQEIKAYEANPSSDKKASAEDLIRYTKPITQATAKAVAAGNSGRQEDVIVVANMGRKAVFDLLGVCKAAAAGAETHDVRAKTVAAGAQCGMAYKTLLEQVNVVLQKPSVEARQQLTVLSRNVATSVSEIVHAAEAIKGTDWVDPEDPTVIAENELLTAASSIEAAAKKLSQLQPRRKVKAADDSLSFDEQILEAAKSIAAATAALVKSASAAQRELVAQGKVGATYHRTDTDDDGQWSQGLISAAKMVAAATHSMCEAANTMVQGNASEEKLIASAKEVAASTAALLVACRVKADPGSKAMQRLQDAGNAVKRATEALVKSAHQAKAYQEEEEAVTINQRMVGGIAQVLAAQEEIIRKEKELERARQQLATIYQHQNRFKEKNQDDDSSSSF